MTSRRLRAEAAVLRWLLTELGYLPNGRTHDVVEQVNLRLGQAIALLCDEAAVLERHERIEANS